MDLMKNNLENQPNLLKLKAKISNFLQNYGRKNNFLYLDWLIYGIDTYINLF